MNDPTTIDVCICTFRRTQIADALRSLAEQKLPADVIMRIIVADNDTTPSAQTLVATTAETFALNVKYIHAPEANISIARNACLAAATADYLAFIDDDEMASPEWLSELLTTQRETNADVVLGPMQASYPENAAVWLSACDIHSTMPVWVKGKIITGYTTNVLLHRSAPALNDLRFREKFGVIGGEDSDFFTRMHAAGGTIAYAANAWTYEPVPSSRATMRWLIRRRLRCGQTRAMITLDMGTSFITYGGMILSRSARLLACASMTILTIPAPLKCRYWLLRGMFHLGMLTYLLPHPPTGKRK